MVSRSRLTEDSDHRAAAPAPDGDGPVLVAIDLETTGLEPGVDEIIEVGAVKFRGREVLGRFTSYVDPGRGIPAFIQQLTGITPADVHGAPSFAAIAGELETFLGDCPIVGQHVSFDLNFLARRGLRPPGPVYDTFDLASVLFPTRAGYSLRDLARHFAVGHDNPHRAQDDAEAAMGVLLGLIDMLRVLPPRVQAGIRTIADRSDWSMRHLLRTVIPPATPSLGATAGAADKIGFEGVDLEDLMKRLDTSPREPRPDEPTPFEPSSAASWFDGEGPLAAVLPGYEPRSEQTAMTEAVAASLSQGSRLVVEAGTGVGKSLAYLLPAVRHAVGNGERVVVSTNTINLQEQLLTKDIPAALETLERVGEIADGEARAALLKGRANYLCLRRWATLRRGESLSAAEARLTAKVLVWLQTTSTGDRNELSLNPQDFPIWSRLSAQGAEGQIGRCPFAKQGRCFYQAARRRAESADVVVVNHALLALGATNDGLLPDYDHLVIDEAHNLEEVVTNQWGFTVNEEAFDRVLERVAGGAAAGTGVATPLDALARSIAVSQQRRADYAGTVEDLQASVLQARRHLTMLFKEITDFATKRSESGGDYNVSLRLTTALRSQPAWSKLQTDWEQVDIALAKLARGVEKAASLAASAVEGEVPDKEGFLMEAQAVADQLAELRDGLRAGVASPDEGGIYWIEVGARDGVTRLRSAPLHVGADLNQRLFDQKKSVVLTSATLSVGESLGYIEERLSLDSANELMVGSPFDYPNRVLGFFPNDIPEPNRSGYQAAVHDAIANAARAAGGRMLVLFTSRASLRTARRFLPDLLTGDEIAVLAQGQDGNPAQLVQRLQSDPRAVVLGTGSFWEGVDIPGDALSVLVITKLPFNVPSDPVFAARSQQFEAPFDQYGLPQAVLRFKQGFGRLIRRKTDKGVLLCLDRRVLTKPYGKTFVDSIPRCTFRAGPVGDVPAAVAEWLASRG